MKKRHILDAISIFGFIAVLTAAALFSLVNPSTRIPLYAGSTFSMVVSITVAILGVASIPIVAYLIHVWKIPFNERKINSMYEATINFPDFDSTVSHFARTLK